MAVQDQRYDIFCAFPDLLACFLDACISQCHILYCVQFLSADDPQLHRLFFAIDLDQCQFFMCSFPPIPVVDLLYLYLFHLICRSSVYGRRLQLAVSQDVREVAWLSAFFDITHGEQMPEGMRMRFGLFYLCCSCDLADVFIHSRWMQHRSLFLPWEDVSRFDALFFDVFLYLLFNDVGMMMVRIFPLLCTSSFGFWMFSTVKYCSSDSRMPV